jgi:hypothetical protein
MMRDCDRMASLFTDDAVVRILHIGIAASPDKSSRTGMEEEVT